MDPNIIGLKLFLLTFIRFGCGHIARALQDDNELINSTDSTGINETTQNISLRRLRSREYRLDRIRQHILSSLGWNNPPIINPEIRQHLPDVPVNMVETENVYTYENQCFSSRCTIPGDIDYSLWSANTNSLRIYQEVPHRTINHNKELLSSKLKLYIRYDTEELGVNDDSRLLISVYQFLRPLHIRRRSGRVINRKRLVDAKMVSGERASWVVLDLSGAVEDWLSGNKRNNGLEIVVKDEDENEVNATSLFKPVDCSSPPNIGCREDEDANQQGTIWSVGSSPYLQIETRHRQRH